MVSGALNFRGSGLAVSRPSHDGCLGGGPQFFLGDVRRKFHEAKETSPKVAGWFLRHFQNLYDVEAQLRQSRAGPRRRQAERASSSRPMLVRLHRALVRLKTVRRYLPQSLMGKAIDYALRQWPSLRHYLDDGRLEIDNNLVENAIRPTAIGKKNWLFFGEADAFLTVPLTSLRFGRCRAITQAANCMSSGRPQPDQLALGSLRKNTVFP